MYDLIELKINEFEQIRALVYSYCGISINPNKKVLVEARLRKRFKALNFDSSDKYFEFLNARENFDREIVELIDVITTNKTDFFREPDHFEYLRNVILPNYSEKNKIEIWSSACSSGEEPYTIAMVMQEFSTSVTPINYEIFASDISITQLRECKKAIYTLDQIEPISENLRQKYLLRNKNTKLNLFRVVPELRNKVSVNRVNLKTEILKIKKTFDVIFCRNVLIYFDKETQKFIVENLIKKLKPDGYLMMGHSESLVNLGLDIKQVEASIYQKTNPNHF